MFTELSTAVTDPPNTVVAYRPSGEWADVARVRSYPSLVSISWVGVLERFVLVGVRAAVSLSPSVCVGVEQREADGVSPPILVEISESVVAVSPMSEDAGGGIEVAEASSLAGC